MTSPSTSQTCSVHGGRPQCDTPTTTRTDTTNTVTCQGVRLNGVFNIMKTVVPIVEQDAHIHKYSVTEDDNIA